jgi:phospholipid transport system substrate-binding protein
LLNLLRKSKYFLKKACLILALLSGSVSAQEDAAPSDVVDQFHDVLLTSMKLPEYKNRLSLVVPAINQFFRPDTIARISLGRNWRDLSDNEQLTYTQLIAVLISTTYASRFNQFDDQRFAVEGEEAITNTRARVRSTLTTKTERVSLQYQLQLVDESWKIYDIVANGVSDLSLKRSNYSALYQRGGMDAVTADIRINIEKNGR